MTVQLMTYTSFCPLGIQDCKTTSLEERVNDICRSTLPDCELIDDPEAFKRQYKEQLARELNSFDDGPFNLLPWGEYDVNQVSKPKLSGQELTFYVKDPHQIPFKVICDSLDHIECGPLPLKY